MNTGEFSKRKVKGNILLAAYYTPVTVQEISMELEYRFRSWRMRLRFSAAVSISYRKREVSDQYSIFSLESKNIIEEKLKCVTKSRRRALRRDHR